MAADPLQWYSGNRAIQTGLFCQTGFLWTLPPHNTKILSVCNEEYFRKSTLRAPSWNAFCTACNTFAQTLLTRSRVLALRCWPSYTSPELGLMSHRPRQVSPQWLSSPAGPGVLPAGCPEGSCTKQHRWCRVPPPAPHPGLWCPLGWSAEVQFDAHLGRSGLESQRPEYENQQLDSIACGPAFCKSFSVLCSFVNSFVIFSLVRTDKRNYPNLNFSFPPRTWDYARLRTDKHKKVVCV